MLRPLFYIPLCHIRYSCRKAVVIFHKNPFFRVKRFSKFGEVENYGLTFSQHGSMVTPTISNARSRGREDRGAADKSSAFAPAQEAGARERGCRRSGNGSCAVCRWFVGEHPPDCHVCGALSRSASCLSPQKVMTGLPDCSTVAAVNASQSIYGFVFCLHRECENPKKAGLPCF